MKIESGTIVEPYMLQISNPDRLVTIRQDGTVEVHKEGADKEAAKLFYEALQIEGKTLHDHIAALKAENETLQVRIDELMFEWCPDEMTPEQIENWKKHQKTVSAK